MEPSFLRAKQMKEIQRNRVKLVLMFVLLVAVVAAMVSLSRCRDSGTPQEPLVGQEATPYVPDVMGEDAKEGSGKGKDRAAGRAPGAARKAVEAEDKPAGGIGRFAYETDPGTLKRIVDREYDLQVHAFFYMLRRVHDEDHEQIRSTAIEKVTWDMAWNKPETLRGKAVRVSGRIVKGNRQPLGANSMGLGEVHWYRVRADGAPADSSGHYYDIYAIEPLAHAGAGDRVTVFGRFLQAYTAVDRHEYDETLNRQVGVVVARRLELGFMQLVRRAARAKHAETRAAAKALDWQELWDKPHVFRGRAIRVSGKIRKIRTHKLDKNDGGLDQLYAYRIRPDGAPPEGVGHYFEVHAVEKLLGARLGEPATVFGHFLKAQAVPADGDGQEKIQAAIVIARRLEPEPLGRMLRRVAQDEPEAIQAEADADATWNEASLAERWKTIWEDPGSIQGKALRVSGQLIKVAQLDPEETPAGLESPHVYQLRAEGAPHDSINHFYEVYSVEKLVGARFRDQVTVYGRFLGSKVSPHPRQRTKRALDVHMAVLVARQLEPLAYINAPEPPGPIVDGKRPEFRAVYWFLKQARDVSAKELKATAKEFTYLDLTTKTKSLRGSPMVLRGELRRLIRMELHENPLGMRDVYWGQIVDRDRKMNTFYCTEIPDGVRLKDPVVIYGYFLKRWDSKSARDPDTRKRSTVQMPVIVGKYMKVIEVESDYTLEIVLVVIVGLTIVILVIAHFRERERQLAVAEVRRQRQMSRVPENLDEVVRRRGGDAADRGDD